MVPCTYSTIHIGIHLTNYIEYKYNELQVYVHKV